MLCNSCIGSGCTLDLVCVLHMEKNGGWRGRVEREGGKGRREGEEGEGEERRVEKGGRRDRGQKVTVEAPLRVVQRYSRWNSKV